MLLIGVITVSYTYNSLESLFKLNVRVLLYFQIKYSQTQNLCIPKVFLHKPTDFYF